jgi:hypothetical protein
MAQLLRTVAVRLISLRTFEGFLVSGVYDFTAMDLVSQALVT